MQYLNGWVEVRQYGNTLSVQEGHILRPLKIVCTYTEMLKLFTNTRFQPIYAGITYVLNASTALLSMIQLTAPVQKYQLRGKTLKINVGFRIFSQ